MISKIDGDRAIAKYYVGFGATRWRLTVDNVSDKDFYSILQATGIKEKRFLKSLSTQNEGLGLRRKIILGG